MFLMIINKSVPEISIPLLTGGAAALFASICLPPMYKLLFQLVYISYLSISVPLC